MTDRNKKIRIVGTKLNKPKSDSRWVKRPRLILALDRCLKKRVMLVSAPAGFGKTTAAVQWADSFQGACAWFSLDKADNDPDRFLRYLVSSIRKVFPMACLESETLLSATEMPPVEYLVDVFVAELEDLDTSLLLVFDDYHLIESDVINEIVLRVVRYLPENIHMVFLSRTNPSWPLGLWRTKGWLDEIGASDLRFSIEEVKDYFHVYWKEEIDNRFLTMLYGQTEGWIAGLQLASFSFSDSDNHEGFLGSFSGTNRYITDFLMDEALSHQPSELLDFLSVTAIFDRFCAPFCDYLLAGYSVTQESASLISFMENKNLFLVPLDSERYWYRYHHLFQELLINHPREYLCEEKKAMFRLRAGEWFEGQGLIEEAIQNYIKSGDVERAASLLESCLHAVIDEDLSKRNLSRILNMFPSESENLHPALLIAHAYLKITNWDATSIAAFVARAEKLLMDDAFPLSGKRRKKLMGDVFVLKGYYLYWSGDIEGSVSNMIKGKEAVPNTNLYAHSLATIYAVGSYALIGDNDVALALAQEAIDCDCASGSLNAGPLLMSKGGVHLYAGHMDEVKLVAERMIEIKKKFGASDYWFGYAYFFMGLVAYEKNDIDSAENHFGHVVSMRYRVNSRLYHDSLIGLSMVNLVRRDLKMAKEYADSALNFSLELQDSYSSRISELFLLKLDFLTCGIYYKNTILPGAFDGTKFWLSVPSLIYFEYVVAGSDSGECLSLLDALNDYLSCARKYHNRRQEIRFLAIMAMAYKKAGNNQKALSVLKESLDLAEPLGFVRTFLDHGQRMQNLLMALLEIKPDSLYVRSLLNAFKSEKLQVSDKKGSYSSIQFNLSGRELEVLKMLSERLSNREIADQLFISPETVKKHTVNIYRKLGVNSRRQAVSAARKLGLLSNLNT